MRSSWFAAMAMALGVAAGGLIHPDRWAAARSAARVGRELSQGTAAAFAALGAQATPPLRPYLSGGHLAAAAAPLKGDRLRQVRLAAFGGATAEAILRFADGRTATVDLLRAADGRWQLAGIR